MMQLLTQLFTVFLPIYQDIVAKYKAAHGTDPTDAEIAAQFEAHVQEYLAEGAAWKAAHPSA